MIPISEVYLYEDRAQIIRRATISLKEGMNLFRLTDLSPLIVQKSVQVSLDSEHPRINYIENSIHILEDETPDGTRPQNSDAMLAEETEASRIAEQTKIVWEQYRDLHKRIAQEIYVQASWGQGTPQKWQEKIERGRAKRDNAFHEYQEAIQKHIRIRKRNKESNVSGHHSPKERTAGKMDIEIYSASTTETTVHITYIVPNACWRPAHRMERLEKTIRFDIGGMVWQKTGVDWENVRIHLSTERASLGTKAPSLLIDSLSVVDEQEHVVLEERDQEQHNVGGSIKMDTMPGINNGGENRLLKATTQMSIPSNGKPYFVHIDQFFSPMTEELMVIADQVPAAVIKTVQYNHATIPILPGPVELIKEQGTVGRAKIDFVSPQESFDICWGGHPSVRIRRTTAQKTEKGSFFSGGTHETHTIALYFSNLGAEELRLRCVERIPVSELDQVHIEKPQLEKLATHAEDVSFDPKTGFIAWTQILPIESRIHHQYTYLMRKDSSVQG
jgi:uncharacterized protein (TIGR02231 family)